MAGKKSLTPHDVRRRAARGAAILTIRGVVVRVAGMGGNIVLARLLVPDDFGVVAFGAAIVVFAGFLADGGIAASLVRRPEPPERETLQVFLGLQLVITTTIAVLVGALTIPMGRVGLVTAVMMAAVPLTALKVPGVVLLERELAFGSLAWIEVLETVAYYTWAIGTVAGGFGVWGLATASVAQSLAGALITICGFTPRTIMRPRLSLQSVRGMLAFGVRYQAFELVRVLREQGLNVGTAAIGGLNMLGLWSIANRVMQVPFLLFSTLWRVLFPTMARLRASGEDLRPLVERIAGATAVGTGALLAPLAASAVALVPAFLGSKWSGAADVIPWASLGLVFAGPISVATIGYFYAVGDASTPLYAATLATAAWGVVALPLLPVVGIKALGLGWLAACVVDTTILSNGIAKRLGAQVLPAVAIPVIFAVASGAIGWASIASRTHDFAGAVIGASVAEVTYLLLMVTLRRSLLIDTARLAAMGFRRNLPVSSTGVSVGGA